VFQDSRGYLWFGTSEGLSRFDGYRFVTYGLESGLPHAIVLHLGEDPQGRLWIAPFRGGLLTLIDRPAARRTGTPQRVFDVHPVPSRSGAADSFLFDADGSVWCVFDSGVYHGTADARDQLTFTNVVKSAVPGVDGVAFTARDGGLWFALAADVFKIRHGAPLTYAAPGAPVVQGFAQRPDGTLLLARRDDVYEYAPPAPGERLGSWRPMHLTLPNRIQALAVDAADRLWIGTEAGLMQLDRGAAHPVPVRGFSTKVSSIVQDREQNLWVSTLGSGVYMIPADLIVNYTRSDGLPAGEVYRTVEGRDGTIYAMTFGGILELRNDGAVLVPGSNREPWPSIGRRILADSRGGWWAWTDVGLMHAPGPRLRIDEFTPVRGVDRSARGTPVGPSLFEDPSGVIWAAPSRNQLFRFDAHLPGAAWTTIDLGPQAESVGRIAADRAGALWLAGYGGLLRLVNGRATIVNGGPGHPEMLVRALFLDSRGWLWIGLRYGGVSVIRDVTAEAPVFVNYGKTAGLSSEVVWSITEDRHGRMYFGTGRGLDRFDPGTGHIEHITESGRLTGSVIWHCMRDSLGNIWVATPAGVSRISQGEGGPVDRAPPVYLTSIQVGGELVPVSERGSAAAAPLEVPQSRSTVRIEYLALRFRGGGPLQYQYMLEGADHGWSVPTEEHAVTYGRLSPGSYRFRVRALARDATPGAETATMAVRVLPPIWRRWWFMSAAAFAVALAGFGLHRFRLRQILATEAVRRQVSRDLHDDVGSGLVQIAVLSELARDDMVFGARAWPDVARLARSLRDSMSDIVWAVDPQKDRLSDLVQRMREVASTLLESDGRVVAFNGPDPRAIERTGMTTDRRRHLLLFFKEAVTNTSRHARANHVTIDLRVSVTTLTLMIADDGCGFDAATVRRGNGLTSLEARARQLRGELTIQSVPGHGTTVLLTVPA
jgi:signal transduction histidine kinase/ligand-binding sensor domain-containing protein